MSEHSERMAQAIQQALSSRGGSLASIAGSQYTQLTASGYLRICPFCEGKGTFAVQRAKSGGHWYWGCHKPSCSVNFDKLKADHCGDTIGFLMVHGSLSRDAAVDKLLDLAGVSNPRKDLPPRKPKAAKKAPAKKAPPKEAPEEKPPEKAEEEEVPPWEGEPKEEAPTAEPTAEEEPAETNEQEELFGTPDATPPDAPPPATTPQKQPGNVVDFALSGPTPPAPEARTVWDDILSRLHLDAGHREELKKKRGFTKETIEKLGFRSSQRSNRALLQPIISSGEWDIRMLLAEGIVTKDSKTGDFKINAQLCGYGLKKRGETTQDDEWGTTDPILIPYFDEGGRCVGIRPHKGGISGKRFMVEQGYELGFRSRKTRVKPYFNPLIWDQPEEWTGRCVLTEGEFKGGALYQTRIPAAAAPGIQMPRNNAFLEELTETLKEAGIKEVIVCFDSEDKSHKPDPWTRHESEVYALYACHALRARGFYASHATLPDEWRIDGKADWDGALAKFGSAARPKFEEVLKSAKRYYPQGVLFGLNEKERIIQCRLNRLIQEPKVLVGGEDEETLARLILRTPMPWRAILNAQEMAEELFESRGCYYMPKKRAYKDLKQEYAAMKRIKELMEETDPGDLKAIAGLEAALAAAEHAIAGRPEILSDFYVECEFLLRKSDGSSEQLMRFINKHGQKSPIISVSSAHTAGAMRFREFTGSVGNFNSTMGDKPLQLLKIDLGYLSAWREIRELEMIGMDPESGLWIFGDCAFTKEGEVLFADDHDVIWHDGIGYRISPDDLKDFAHRDPPRFFTKLGMEPHEVLAAIRADPDKEEREVARIFFQLAVDLIATFGDGSGLLVLGVILAYTISPELLTKYHGHPGLWIHGRLQAGKTETSAFLMQLWGYCAEYRTATLSTGTTNVSIDRWLAQYSNILMHLDEFRQGESDKARTNSLRLPFNRQSKGKGKMTQDNKTRSVQAATSPMVTGEGVTNDSATLSRYVEAVLSVDRRLGTKAQQIARFDRMKNQSASYHRIIRWILMRRSWFAKQSLEKMAEFTQQESANKIQDRLRITYGSAFCCFTTLWNHFGALALNNREDSPFSEMSKPDMILLTDTTKSLETFTIEYAKKASADVAAINFVVKFWKNVMDLYQRDNQLKRFVWFEWCQIDMATNRVVRTTAKQDAEGIVRCVIVNWDPLYSEVAMDLRKQGTEPDLSLQNIRRETGAERYYVPGPKHVKNGSHRMTFDKKQTTVTVLRVDMMDPSLREVFDDRFDEDDEPELSI